VGLVFLKLNISIVIEKTSLYTAEATARLILGVVKARSPIPLSNPATADARSPLPVILHKFDRPQQPPKLQLLPDRRSK